MISYEENCEHCQNVFSGWSTCMIYTNIFANDTFQRCWRYWNMFSFNTGYDYFMVIVMTLIHDDRNECSMPCIRLPIFKKKQTFQHRIFTFRCELKRHINSIGRFMLPAEFSDHFFCTRTHNSIDRQATLWVRLAEVHVSSKI